MSLIKCPECSKEFSDTSWACVHCGYSYKKNKITKDAKSKTYSIFVNHPISYRHAFYSIFPIIISGLIYLSIGPTLWLINTGFPPMTQCPQQERRFDELWNHIPEWPTSYYDAYWWARCKEDADYVTGKIIKYEKDKNEFQQAMILPNCLTGLLALFAFPPLFILATTKHLMSRPSSERLTPSPSHR